MTEQNQIEEPDVVRDTELEKRLLAAVIADRNDQPRSKQLQVGPSQVGGCRELLRAGLFESDKLAEPESYWAAAAHVGTVMGDSLESIFGKRLDALTQQRITTLFEDLGVRISGAIDLLFMNEGHVSDLKSTTDIGGVLYDLKRNAAAIETLLSIWREGRLYNKSVETADGGYELTEAVVRKMSKLHYYVQVAIYVKGAKQAGVLDASGEGRLIFYDRAGDFQEFVAVVLNAEVLDMFYDIAQKRIEQVLEAQALYEEMNGNPVAIQPLRDMMPSYCFSKKVQCPLREHCWGGSAWTEDKRIDNPEQIAAVERYIIGRDMAKIGEGMKRGAREELREVEGVLPDGRMVTWVRGGAAINVVETTAQAAGVGQALDTALAVMSNPPKPTREMRERELSKMRVDPLRELATAAGLSPEGKKAEVVQAILDHEYPAPQEG